MSTFLLLPAGIVATTGYLLQHFRGRRHRRARQRLAALAQVRGLRRLLEKIPQHRGMANAFLQGNAGFRTRLAGLEGQIDADAHVLRDIAGHTECRIVAARCRRIEGRWTEIKEELERLSATRSFELHSRLVRELLYLINDVADEGGLLDPHTDFSLLADAAINLLPAVTETQGQARGMGTGAAAQQQCDIPQQVKLRYLLQRTRDTLARASEELHGRPEINGLESCRVATEEFLQLLETRVIDSAHIDIPSERIFDAGTRAIDLSFALLDQLLDGLQAALEADASRHTRRWRLAQAGAAGLLLPATWLALLAF